MTTTSSRRLAPFALGGLLALIAIVVVMLGIFPALQRRAALAQATSDRSTEAPRVVVAGAVAAPATVRVSMPARLEALQDTALYAQIGGYLGPMRADVGDAVKAGQVLVEIQTPVLDREIQQVAANAEVARAKIQLAEARLSLSEANAKRLRSVTDTRAVSQQALDEADANVKSDRASLAAAKADLDAVTANGARLAAQKSLASIVAPFDGEVTQRAYDQGALVVADKTDAAKPIFGVTNRSQVRAFVDVPQSLAPRVRVDMPISFSVRELPGVSLAAKVTRVAPELNDVTRTRMVEARIDNTELKLLPGMFADAVFQVDRAQASTMVPGEAILIRDGKTAVAVVDAQDQIRYVQVQLGQDTGSQVEIMDGIPVGSRVAVSLSRQHPEGTKVMPSVKKPAT